jgi:hypothetical protein
VAQAIATEIQIKLTPEEHARLASAHSVSPFSTEGTLNFNGSTSTADALTTLDSLGRVHVSQRKQSQGATTYDSAETEYDSLVMGDN